MPSSFALIKELFVRLYSEYGPQHWWPAKTRFEVCVGAILTQNTSWKNVEKAILNLKSKRLLDRESMLNADLSLIQEAIRPAGFYRQKAERLELFCERVDLNALSRMSLRSAREHLLSIKGIGRETADSILLYALNKPIFVIDAYTKRIYSRLIGIGIEDIGDYDDLRQLFENALGKSASRYNEMHALLVQHAKLYCKKSSPLCSSSCPVSHMCAFAQKTNFESA